MVRRGLLIGFTLAGLAGFASAQTPGKPDSVLPGRPDQTEAELDSPFLSSSAGISVRPPAGGKMIRRAGVADEVVRFVNDEQKWQLVVSRFMLTDPMPLMTTSPKPGDGTPRTIGFVDSIMGQMSDGEPIRQEALPISGYDGALLSTRAKDATGTKLVQHAIVRRSDKIYYVVTFTTPVGEGKADQDPQVRSATALFDRVADSIELLDQQPIANDQTERLLRTRNLMVNWSQAKLDAALVREQWLRLMKDGKDIGYSYIIEEPANDLPRAGKASATPEKPLGVRIGVRSRTVPEADFVVDAESWMWVSYSRDQEAFSNLVMSRDKGQEPNYAIERGTAIRRDQMIKLDQPDPKTGNTVQSVKGEQYELQIWSTSKQQTMPPLVKQLPPFYLPQALGQLLPRLLPLNTPNTYMWGSYVSEMRNVMVRYVDVLPATAVALNGKTFNAVPVQERLGLEGSITTHYIAADGTYRGSVNEDTKITIIPADKETILSIWKDANLNRPGDVDEKK
jgi:hypothetical protein